MPKSGSTFLSGVISELPGFRRATLVPSFGRREQELDLDRLRNVDRYNYVAQHHIRHSDWTAELASDFRLKPVVLVRGLLDVVVSLRDHVRRDSSVVPVFFAEAPHTQVDDERLEQMIARLALPWYVNFYMSWRKAPGTLLVEYENLAAAPAAVVGSVMDHAKAPASASTIQKSIDRILARGEGRLNVGVTGRGALLRPDTIRTVMEMVDFYPEAAADPYIRSLRRQAAAALCGEPIAATSPASPSAMAGLEPPVRPKQRWYAKRRRALVRWLGPAVILSLAAFYRLWPNDLIPDSTAFGQVDDAVVLMVFSLFAGRLTKYK
jgi:hypothetical protein